MNDEPLLEFFGRLEQTEARLLSWGLVDGTFSKEELLSRIERFLTEKDLWEEFGPEENFLSQLRDRRLLFDFLDGTEFCYRTRTAETVRLLARLRQLFPKHLDNGRRWQTAKPLVGDFRFLLRPRSSPRREFAFEKVRERLNEIRDLSDLQSDILQTLLRTESDTPMELSGFQLRATVDILRKTHTTPSSGTIVCAGTGSGKTLSFYLPAFLHISSLIDSNCWTRCLAVYPRTELLKDQLSEAYIQARSLDPVLASHGKRKMTIGTLFGGTPSYEGAFNYKPPPRGWRQLGDGFVCPFMRCPTEGCTGDLLWRDGDRNEKRHILHCQRCDAIIEHDELILTRERLKSEPPDILFTTAEMLNQRIGDAEFCHLFGVGTSSRRKPSLVLLDEVHTYSGVSGAQIALLLRRWKHASRAKPHFVGLSATLVDARRFFARLVGVDDFLVEDIVAQPGEIKRDSMEYLLAVRGDPASGAALLSTTIQTSMLMRRVLAADNGEPGSNVFGKKVFVFTDDLDVTNRLFFNLRDAEGQDSFGRPLQDRPEGSLANLRSRNLPESGLRHRFGQSWDLCEWIGHNLDHGTDMVIGRTSSQDAGVTPDADLIVATASLEVGFNDPDVNVVIQHKSPRDPAQFLQRKGRAGRRLNMRPWTIVVLSDYGRDRLVWQSYDILFDPELPARDLPVSNRYVLRMQAVFAFFDWIGEQLRLNRSVPKGSVWRAFSAPSHLLHKPGSRNEQDARTRQDAARDIIEGLLFRDERYDELVDYLSKALAQSPEDIEPLLWEPPRALMTAALPTLLRRLEKQWQRTSGDPGDLDYHISNNPLPEFVPATLFGDLNLPEVAIISPAQQRGGEEHTESLPIQRAMREFAPGRVSRRFGVMNDQARHWIAPPKLTELDAQKIPLSKLASRFDELGDFQYFLPGHKSIETVRCVRPVEVRVEVPPQNVRDSSNSQLTWHSQIGADTRGLAVELPARSRWEHIIKEISFFTHNHHSSLEIRRFSTSATASVVFETSLEFDTTLHFVDDALDGESATPIGLGFATDVDGLVVRIDPPTDLLLQVSEDPTALRSLRIARFQDLIAETPELDGHANFFQRQWLSQVFVSALAFRAMSSNISLSAALGAAADDPDAFDFDGVLSVIFHSIPVSGDGDFDSDSENENSQTVEDKQQRLHRELADLLEDPDVIEVLFGRANVLWTSPDDDWLPWLRRKFAATLGAAFLDAIQQVCPELDSNSLILDIDPGPRPDGSDFPDEELEELWISERTVGGGGVIENFLIRYGEDPRRFFDLLEAALAPSDTEIADDQLSLFLEWTTDSDDTTVGDMVVRLRSARGESHDEYAKVFQDLRSLLTRRGLFVSHPVMAALGTRILRPGATAETDQLLHNLVVHWKSQESTLGIEIDMRMFAFLHCGDDALDRALGEFEGDHLLTDRRQWRFDAIYSLLWPRGRSIRSEALQVYNPFAALPETERELVGNALGPAATTVRLNNPDWLQLTSETLLTKNTVVIVADLSEIQVLRTAIITLLSTQIDTGFLLVHPRMTGFERHSGQLRVTMEIVEGIQ